MPHDIRKPGRRVVGLLRVSTPKQAKEGYSLAEQERMIRDCCEREGWDLVEVLADEGKSGRKGDRPAVRRMVELAEAGAFEVLVFVKVDRAGRKLRVIQDILHEARRRGIEVYFVEGGRTDTKHGRFMLNIMGSVAELAWEDIRELLMQGKLEKAAEGFYPGAVRVYGAHCVLRWEALADPSRTAGSFEVDETEAAGVRQAFLWYRDTGSLRETARRLTESGYPSPSGSSVWHLPTVRNLLRRACYVSGEMVYGRREYYELQVVRERPEAEQRRIPFPVIVDRDLWDAVQERLDAAHEIATRGRPSARWLLRGAVWCGQCRGLRGEPLRCSGASCSSPSSDRKRWSRYLCNSQGHASLPRCNTYYAQKELEALAVARLKASLEAGEWGKVARVEQEREREAKVGSRGKVRELETELGKLDGRARNLVELAARGVAADLVVGELTALDRRRAALRAELAALQAGRGRGETPAQAGRAAEAWAKALRERWDEIEQDPELLQAVLQQTVRVTLWKGAEPDIVVKVRQVILPR